MIPNQDLMRCGHCKKEKPLSEMSSTAVKGGSPNWCKECVREYARQRRITSEPKTGTMICTKCGLEKPVSEMSSSAVKGTGANWCKDCTNELTRKWRNRVPGKAAAYMREYRAKYPERHKKQAATRRKKKIAEMNPMELELFRKQETDHSRYFNQKLREEVFDAYGHRCACCGESNPFFLSIDHIDNDGAQKRKSGEQPKGGTSFYRWLKKNGFPKGFQVLCMNCNVGKHRNGGICPHQVRRNDYSVKEVGPSGSKRTASQRDDEIVCSA
jgi:hypothetical protein